MNSSKKYINFSLLYDCYNGFIVDSICVPDKIDYFQTSFPLRSALTFDLNFVELFISCVHLGGKAVCSLPLLRESSVSNGVYCPDIFGYGLLSLQMSYGPACTLLVICDAVVGSI